MIDKLPEVEGFTSDYNEKLDAVIFTHEPTAFHQAISAVDLRAIARSSAWGLLAEVLNRGVDNYRTLQPLNRYKPEK